MKNKRFLLIFSQIFIFCTVFAQQINSEITVNELKSTIGFLASDSLKGRKPGSKEIAVAASYIQSQFKKAGLKTIKNNGLQSVNALVQ